MVAPGVGYTAEPPKCRFIIISPTVKLLVKNQEVKCATFSHDDCSCSQNL